VQLPDGLLLGNVDRSDLIAFDHRWVVVLGCTQVNEWVTIRLSGLPVVVLVAKAATPVHLARPETARAAG
jgi:hypothetical protein